MSKQTITLELPDEFAQLCAQDGATPETVLQGFIADLCALVSWHDSPRGDGYCSNGSDERDLARAYYDRVGYSDWREQS